MREDVRGNTIVEGAVRVCETRLSALSAALGTSGGADTARLLPFFGATVIGGESAVADGLGMDLARSLLAGLRYEWHRPFNVGETVQVKVVIDDVYAKGDNQFGIVVAEFTDEGGDWVQRQWITFVEMGVNG